MYPWGFKVLMIYPAVLMVLGLYRQSRFLRVNSSAKVVGQFVISVISSIMILWAVMTGQNIFLIALITTITSMMFFGFIIINKKQVYHRTDYNLFLRSATDGIIDMPSGDTCKRLFNDQILISYAKFLGQQWLVKDYTLSPDDIVLRLPDVQSDVCSVFRKPTSSHIVITRSGECTAILSYTDLKAIAEITGSAHQREELKRRVCCAVQNSLYRFANGDINCARSILTAHSDESIYGKPVYKTSHWYILWILVFAGLVWELFMFTQCYLHICPKCSIIGLWTKMKAL